MLDFTLLSDRIVELMQIGGVLFFIALGAFAYIMLAIVINVFTYCGKKKWATTNAATTNKEPPKASKTVITMTLLPSALIVAFLKEVPIEKAMKPKATVLTQLILSTC